MLISSTRMLSSLLARPQLKFQTRANPNSAKESAVLAVARTHRKSNNHINKETSSLKETFQLKRKFATELKDSLRQYQEVSQRRLHLAQLKTPVALDLPQVDASNSVSIEIEVANAHESFDRVCMNLYKSMADVKYNVNIHIYTFFKYFKTKQLFFIYMSFKVFLFRIHI